MSKFFAPNIDSRGRIIRAIWAVLMIVAGGLTLGVNVWISVVLFAFGGLAAFEALRGWCVMRACGVKTKF